MDVGTLVGLYSNDDDISLNVCIYIIYDVKGLPAKYWVSLWVSLLAQESLDLLMVPCLDLMLAIWMAPYLEQK